MDYLALGRALVSLPIDLLAPPTCATCDEPLARDAVYCARCVSTLVTPPKLPDDVTAGHAFGGAVAELLHRIKYARRADLIRQARRLVCERLPREAHFDAVAPLSAHRLRLVERGFDLASLLAVTVASQLRRPLRLGLLARKRNVRRMVGLDSEARRAEISGVFVARNVEHLTSVLLVDDVHTTGATFADAKRALAERGVSARLHVLAATPSAVR